MELPPAENPELNIESNIDEKGFIKYFKIEIREKQHCKNNF